MFEKHRACFVLSQQNLATFLLKNKFMLQKYVDGREVKADSLKNIRVCQGSRETKSKTVNVKKEGAYYRNAGRVSL